MHIDVEYLIATTNRSDLKFLQKMNITDPAIVMNQNGRNEVLSAGKNVMFSTSTRGVGVNRNIALNLAKAEYGFIVDDDMVFYDGINNLMERALKKYPDADVIIFNFDYVKDDKFVRPRMKKTGAINITNCLHYGICCALVKMSSIRKENISFSTLFGGGCVYSCGEDSLFFLECVRKGLKIYTYQEPVGRNEYRESSWFKGYNEKFFYDKGAWIACAFPHLKHLVKWYFVVRLGRLSDMHFRGVIREINQGIKGYDKIVAYSKES